MEIQTKPLRNPDRHFRFWKRRGAIVPSIVNEHDDIIINPVQKRSSIFGHMGFVPQEVRKKYHTHEPLCLVSLGPDAKIDKAWYLRDGFIGRNTGPDSILTTHDPSVEPVHARVHVENDVYYVQDNDSANGSYLCLKTMKRSRRQRDGYRLRVDDMFRVGWTGQIIVKSFQTEAKPPPPTSSPNICLFRACSINTLDTRNNPVMSVPGQCCSARPAEIDMDPQAMLKRRSTAGMIHYKTADEPNNMSPPPQKHDEDSLASPPTTPTASEASAHSEARAPTEDKPTSTADSPAAPLSTPATTASTTAPLTTDSTSSSTAPAAKELSSPLSTTPTGSTGTPLRTPTQSIIKEPSEKRGIRNKPKQTVHFGGAFVTADEPWDKASNDYVRPNIKNTRFWFHEKLPVSLILAIKHADSNEEERIVSLGNKGVYIIGSSPKCDVQVVGEGIHPVHARIVFDGYYFVLQDLSFEPSVRRRTRVLLSKPTQVERSDILLFGECCLIVEDEKHAFPYKLRHATSLPDTHFALRSHIYRFSKRKKRCRMRYSPVVFILSNKEELEVGRNPALNGYFRTTSLCSIHFTIEARHGVCYLTPHYGGLNQGVYLLVGRNPFYHLDDQPQDPVRITSKALLLQENMVFRLGNTEFEVCCIKRSPPSIAISDSYSNMLASLASGQQSTGEYAASNSIDQTFSLKSTTSPSPSSGSMGRNATTASSADYGRSQNSFREDAQAMATAKRAANTASTGRSVGRSDRSFRQYMLRQKQREKAIRSEFARILGDLPWMRQLALALDVMETLVTHAAKVDLMEGDVVYNQGDPASFFFLLLTGEVSLSFYGPSASTGASGMTSPRTSESPGDSPSSPTSDKSNCPSGVNASSPSGGSVPLPPLDMNQPVAATARTSARDSETGIITERTGSASLPRVYLEDGSNRVSSLRGIASRNFRPGSLLLSNALAENLVASPPQQQPNATNNASILPPLQGNNLPLHTEKVPAGSYFGEVIFMHDRREEISYGEMARATTKCSLLVFNREDFFGYCAPYLNVLLPQFEYEQFKPFLYHLRKLQRFEFLNYDELRVLAGHAQVMEYQPNEIITSDPTNHFENSLLFLIEGTIESFRKAMPIEYSPFEMVVLTNATTATINTSTPPPSMVTNTNRTSSAAGLNIAANCEISRAPTPTALPPVDLCTMTTNSQSSASSTEKSTTTSSTSTSLPVMPMIVGAIRKSGSERASLGTTTDAASSNSRANSSASMGPSISDTSGNRKFGFGVVACSKVKAIKLLESDIEKCMESFTNDICAASAAAYSPYETRRRQFVANGGGKANGGGTSSNNLSKMDGTPPGSLKSRRNLTKQNSFARRQSLSQRSLLLTAKEQSKETGSQIRFESNKDDYAGGMDDDGNGSFEDASDDGGEGGNGQKWRRKKKNPELLEQTIAAVLSNEEMPNALVLYVLSGANRGDIHVVRNVCTIGNSIDENGEYPNGGWGLNDIELNDQYVSRTHAFVEHRDGKYWLYDEWSEWGTFVRLDEENQNALEITAGDTFVAGEIEFTCMMTLPSNEKSKMCVLQ